MKIKEKIYLERDGLAKEGPITIVAFGDSVTQGCLVRPDINYETVYWNLLRKKLLSIRHYVPINVINAGIGGITATESVGRMDRQVLAHNPDLIIVCFGLNDVIVSELDEYIAALREIFKKSLQSGAEVIFMTPNMLNTYVAEDTPLDVGYAVITADVQNSGKMDRYMEAAGKLATDMGVTLCDCYSKWKELAKTQDTTKCLINRINHPTPEMHELFAEELFHIIMGGDMS